MKRSIVLTIMMFTCSILMAQDPSAEVPKFEWSGYIDLYYAYYTDSMDMGDYQQFATVAPRSNEFSLNIAQVSLSYTTERIRANATLHYGDIPSSSWSSTFNFLQQAYVGYSITEKLWIEAGLFTTHIGTELLLPKDNMLSTLALGTYHEPYFQSGVALKYDPSETLTLQLHLLNGYNNFLDNNRSKSVGVFIKKTFSDAFAMSYSNLFGSELNTSKKRFYNNLVASLTPTDKLSVVLGGDWGTENGSKMYSAIATVKLSWSDKFATILRGEHFNDEDGFLSGQFQRSDEPTMSGLVASGITLGLEYKPTSNAYVRFETRRINTSNSLDLFNHNQKMVGNRTDVVLTTGVWF